MSTENHPSSPTNSPSSPTYKVYVVFRGWVPGIYMTMEEVMFQIREYDGEKWSSYNTLDEAEEAYLLFLGDGQRNIGIELINSGDAPEPVETDDHGRRQRIVILALHERYQHEAGLPLPHFLTEKALVPKKPTAQPLLPLSMIKMLKDACNHLRIPHPICRNISNKFRDGRIDHCHLVSIVPPGSSEALVQCGRYLFNLESSMEDAARLCLRTLSHKLERPIWDYNYDLLTSIEQRHNELEEDYKGLLSKLQSVNGSKTINKEKVFDLDKIPHNDTVFSSSSIGGQGE
ncbi:hypothetical protein PIB30_047137 [Stylosanthes scabra]|uniref:Ribonuclease H1 N-terminal domain-containing protein n=1 Tax=Stylosanthes scabra TaxID=79078 RepID=A0ABU6VG23_9FABA|nr:hypothetical protein [Stylosanthes scabra]